MRITRVIGVTMCHTGRDVVDIIIFGCLGIISLVSLHTEVTIIGSLEGTIGAIGTKDPRIMNLGKMKTNLPHEIIGLTIIPATIAQIGNRSARISTKTQSNISDVITRIGLSIVKSLKLS